MIAVGTTIKELIDAQKEQDQTTLERLARKADMSWSQFHTVYNEGISGGTRFSTIKKIARILNKPASELIQILEAD